MQELDVKQTSQVNGGLPIVVAIPAAYLARKYGAKALVGAGAVAVGWFSE